MAVLPQAQSGMRAGVLLGLARALGEAIAVFMVIGPRRPAPRVTRRRILLPRTPRPDAHHQAGRPPTMLAGTSGPYFAALCGLGIILLTLVTVATVRGTRGSTGRAVRAPRARRSSAWLRTPKRTGSPPPSGSGPCCCRGHSSSACSASCWPAAAQRSIRSSGSRPPKARRVGAYAGPDPRHPPAPPRQGPDRTAPRLWSRHRDRHARLGEDRSRAGDADRRRQRNAHDPAGPRPGTSSSARPWAGAAPGWPAPWSWCPW
ncbi:hypothetical protein SNARM312S_01418 [Streptomyces narbonensis]